MAKSRSRSKFNPRRHITEVKGVEVYSSTVVVKRYAKLPHQHEHKRREILNLSADSLARLAFIAFNTPAQFPSLITLTYPDILDDGVKVKYDLNQFLAWYRYHFPGRLYFWWLEFQRRGSPHFHVLTSLDLAGLGRLATIHRQNGDTWQTHWDTWQKLEAAWGKLGGGMTAWEVINDQEGGKKYAAAYATKAYQKAVPEGFRDVGRFWGHSREGVKPEPNGYYECSEAQLREALERGGWEYLPDDAGFLFRELYQAASAIDVGMLRPAPKPEPAGYALPVRSQSAYKCQSCGGVFSLWRGQCSDCEEWHTLLLVS